MLVVRLLAGGAAWLLGVAGVAGVGCLAVDNTGHRAAPEAAVDIALAGRARPALSAPSPATAPSRSRPASRSATRSLAPAAQPEPSAPSSSARPPAPSASARPSSAPSTTSPSPPPPAPASPSPAPPPSVVSPAVTTSPTPTASPATRSFTAPAGRVVVSCLGAALHDWSLEPASSASIRAIRLSDAELGIRMVDASGTVLHVLATCRDGGPVFTTS